MIRKAGVNRVFQFALTVREYLDFARSGVPEPRLLDALKGLRQLTYGGMAIPKEPEDWAYDAGIPITVRSFHSFPCLPQYPLILDVVAVA